MQANGAEMLRLACIALEEDGIGICAPVHDAILIEAPLEKIDQHVAHATSLMRKASEWVLGCGRQCHVDATTVRCPGSVYGWSRCQHVVVHPVTSR